MIGEKNMFSLLLLGKSNLTLIQKMAIGATSAVTTAWTAANVIENKMRNYDTEVYPPVDTVTVIIPTLNEEQFIEKMLTSITNQSIINQYPNEFEFILVDSGSEDNTIPIAESFIDNIIRVPIRGKLTARNIATNEAKGNIIVSVDADCIYDYNWLNTLLRPFNDYTNPKYDNVVGVNGSTIDYSIDAIPGQINTLSFLFQQKITKRNRMYGRNSAFYRHAFYESGMFNEESNQFDVKTMVKEEEVGFGNRLAKLGKVIYKTNATCIHLGGAKIDCRLGNSNSDICSNYKIGIERFG